MNKMKIIFIAVILLIFFYIDLRKENEISRKYLQSADIKLSGIVTNVIETSGFNGYGIITLRVLKSNILNYDPRSYQEFYYCIIKDSIAEIYDHAFKYMIGDTLNIDTKRKLHCWGSVWNEDSVGSIKINPIESYYLFISKHTRFQSIKKPI